MTCRRRGEADLEICQTGIGYDIHRLVSGRKLVFRPVEIPFLKRGRFARPDGDVLIRAYHDCLLGACGLLDIGTQFLNREARYKDISSLKLLKEVKRKIRGLRLKYVMGTAT